MNADTAKALDNARKPKHARLDVRHHECETPRDTGVGAAELWEKLDTLSM